MELKAIFVKGKIWTFSNIMSLSRLILGVIIFYLILGRSKTMAIIFSIAAIITDYLDGYIARKRGEVTELGKILDPLADKIAIALGTIALYYAFNLPLWVLLVILLRDILIVLGAYFLFGKIQHVMSSDFPGKIAVTIISFLILIYLLEFNTIKPLFIVLTVIAITVSFVFYLYKFIKILNTE